MSTVHNIKGLTPADWRALAIVGKKADDYRDELEPGRRQPVDFLLRVQGYLDVFPDGTTTRASKPSAEYVLGLLLAKILSGEQAEQLKAVLAEAAKDGKRPEVADDWLKHASCMLESLTSRGTYPKRGATKGDFQVGQVELDSLSPTVSASLSKASRAINFED